MHCSKFSSARWGRRQYWPQERGRTIAPREKCRSCTCEKALLSQDCNISEKLSEAGAAFRSLFSTLQTQERLLSVFTLPAVGPSSSSPVCWHCSLPVEEALVWILSNTMTQDSQLCHVPGKTRLHPSANGLPPGAGVPVCFPDFSGSLQLMGQQCDRGKSKIHSWAASAGETGTQCGR